MTKDEAWKVIDACKGWNVSQESFSANADTRKLETEIFNARRKALAKAWEVVGDDNVS